MATVRIPLSGGKAYTIIDEEDQALVSRHRWYVIEKPRASYAMTTVTDPNGKQKNIRLHRLILDAPKGMDVDHINSDGLDNRRSNLRLATRTENMQNQRKQHRGTNTYKGVTFDKRKRRWRAEIRINGKRTILGIYKTEEEAARAYDVGAVTHFGQFARLNFADTPVAQIPLPLRFLADRPVSPRGFRGVTRDKRRGKWVAQIQINGKHLSLGQYSSPEEAARAYDAKARELLGDQAILNFA